MSSTPQPADRTMPDQIIEDVVKSLTFNKDGLISAIAQQYDSGEVLMLAWMNGEAVRETLATEQVCYWSRSRKQLWRKGEKSGQNQRLMHFRIDCDNDCLLLLVDQAGVACHTGRRSCFYTEVTSEGLSIIQPVEIDPEALYGSDGQ